MTTTGTTRMRLASRKEIVGNPNPDLTLPWPHPATDRNLTLSWWDQSPERGDRGPLEQAVGTHLLTADDPVTGRRAGYLKVSYTTEVLCADAYPTLLHFAAHLRGWHLPHDDRPRTWIRAHHYARRCPASITAAGNDIRPAALSDGDVPDPGTVEADLTHLTAGYAADYQEWKDCFAVPFVAYSDVHADLRRGGIGTAMYVAAARLLGTRGQILRGSGNQSPHAIALWDHLQSEPAYPTRTVDVTYRRRTRTYPALDYTPAR